jgi:hypothetical protein
MVGRGVITATPKVGAAAGDVVAWPSAVALSSGEPGSAVTSGVGAGLKMPPRTPSPTLGPVVGDDGWSAVWARERLLAATKLAAAIMATAVTPASTRATRTMSVRGSGPGTPRAGGDAAAPASTWASESNAAAALRQSGQADAWTAMSRASGSRPPAASHEMNASWRSI